MVEPKPLVARVSYGKRVRIPEEVLAILKLEEGDMVMFTRLTEHSFEMKAAKIVPRGDE